MARPRSTTDVDQILRVIHERNAMCSRMLLKALHLHHGNGPIPDLEPEPSSTESVTEFPPSIIPTSKIEQIKRIVCGRYRLSKAEIETNSRKPRVVIARQIGMYLANQLGYSLPEIGRRFGGRDHVTVLYACRKISGLAGSDVKLAAQLAEIQAEISA